MNSGATFLSRLPLFADVSHETLARFEHRMRRRDFAPLAVIVQEGSSVDSAFLVLSGRVAVRRRDPESGIDFLLAEFGDGEMFGEMALLTRKPRTASVVALEATTCGIIEQSDFDQLLAEHPAAVRSMMAALADVPISFANNRLTLAMTNPANIVAFDDVRRVIKGVLIAPAVVTEGDFKRFMSVTYPQLVAQDDATPQRQSTPRSPGPSAAAPQAVSAPVDLLESDLIRELQFAADTDGQKPETKQDLASASEDAPIIPIAYDLPGVTQIQANSAIGLTFASILLAFLRQDPDMLLLGETRGKETAKTAVEAALTGHLVFTTLHTNSAAVAFTRLHEMEIEPVLVSQPSRKG